MMKVLKFVYDASISIIVVVIIVVFLAILISGCSILNKKSKIEKVPISVQVYVFAMADKKFCRNLTDCLDLTAGDKFISRGDVQGAILMTKDDFKKITTRLEFCSQ